MEPAISIAGRFHRFPPRCCDNYVRFPDHQIMTIGAFVSDHPTHHSSEMFCNSQSITDVLPQEVIDAICDHVASECSHNIAWLLDKVEPMRSIMSTLHGLSLTCRAFRSRCHHHVFSIIHIQGSPFQSGARHESLKSILQTSPAISCAIKHLQLRLETASATNLFQDRDSITDLLRTATACNVKYSVLTLYDLGKSQPRHMYTPKSFITTSIDTSLITDLQLSSVGIIPLSLFARCTNLNFLYLDRVFTESRTELALQTDFSSHRLSHSPRPRSLHLHGATSAMMALIDNAHDILPILDLSQVEALALAEANCMVTDIRGSAEVITYRQISMQCASRVKKLGLSLGRSFNT